MKNRNLLLLLSSLLFICDYSTLRKGLLKRSKQEAKSKFKMCHPHSTNEQLYICKQFSKTHFTPGKAQCTKSANALHIGVAQKQFLKNARV